MKTIHIKQVLKEDSHYTTIQKFVPKQLMLHTFTFYQFLLSQRIKPMTLVLLAPFSFFNHVQESHFILQGHIKKWQ